MNELLVYNYFYDIIKVNPIILRYFIGFLDCDKFYEKWHTEIRDSRGKKGRRKRRKKKKAQLFRVEQINIKKKQVSTGFLVGKPDKLPTISENIIWESGNDDEIKTWESYSDDFIPVANDVIDDEDDDYYNDRDTWRDNDKFFCLSE